MRESRVRFIRQQGFVTQEPTEALYFALMLQPRVIGAVTAIGIIAQSPLLFLTLAAVLWWSALVPARNPFDVLYNQAVARPGGLPPLSAAPAPRRFAIGLAGTFAFAIGLALMVGAHVTAWVVEGLLAIAIMQVVFRDFCAGSNLYYFLQRGLMAKLPHSTGATRR